MGTKQRGATKAQLEYRAQKILEAARAAQSKLAVIAQVRRPTEAEAKEARAAYAAAAAIFGDRFV